ncbi:protein Mis18-alpha-like [Mytilus edulis]|uniref:protein Mis18-alpha-like n=1 Tax=Mytilus edulis TaxID=6550 RepID=UPI0039F00F6A
MSNGVDSLDNAPSTDESPTEENPNQTLVLQCSQCSSIMGDTTAWAFADDVLRTVSLKNASEKVLITEVLDTSKNGTDFGSAFNVLKCEVCNEEIGRMYRTTPTQLDHLRGLFSLFIDKLTSYQVGSCSQSCQALTLDDTLSFGELKEMHTKLNKIKHVLVTVDGRLKHIETFLEEYDDQPESVPDESHNIIPAENHRKEGSFHAFIPPQQPEAVRRPETMSREMFNNGVTSENSVQSYNAGMLSSKGAQKRPAFRKFDEGNSSVYSRSEDVRQETDDGLQSSYRTSQSYMDTNKRKKHSDPRADNSTYKNKRSKY